MVSLFFNFIVKFMYSGVFIVNFEHISHLAEHEKCRNMCFILKKIKVSLKYCNFKCFSPAPHPHSHGYISLFICRGILAGFHSINKDLF